MTVLLPFILEQKQIFGLFIAQVRNTLLGHYLGSIFIMMNNHLSKHFYIFFLIPSAAICYMFNNWTGMDREKAKEYILRCQVCGC